MSQLLHATPTFAELQTLSGIDITQTIQAQINGLSGGGGYPSVITTASLASNFTITGTYTDAPGGGTTAVTGLTCTITTTRTNEIVHLSYVGETVQAVGAADVAIGYQIDSGTAVVRLYSAMASQTSYTFPLVINEFITVTGAPGSYAIKLTAAKSTGTPALARRVSEGTATDLILMKVTQFA